MPKRPSDYDEPAIVNALWGSLVFVTGLALLCHLTSDGPHDPSSRLAGTLGVVSTVFGLIGISSCIDSVRNKRRRRRSIRQALQYVNGLPAGTSRFAVEVFDSRWGTWEMKGVCDRDELDRLYREHVEPWDMWENGRKRRREELVFREGKMRRRSCS